MPSSSLARPALRQREQHFGQAAGIVAGHLILNQQVGAKWFDAQFAHGIEVQHDGRGSVIRVSLQQRG